MKLSGIYNIRNLINSDIYVGSAINLNNRWCVHRNYLLNNKHVNSYLQHAWNKHGFDNFIFEILEYVDQNKLIEREQYWIDNLNPKYNIRKIAESNLGLKWSYDSRKKASDRMMGNIPWNKGRKGVSEETRKKLSDARKTRISPPMLGRNQTEESKEKIRGEKNGRSKLTIDEVIFIREYYKNKKINQVELSKLFNVSTGTINKIIKCLIWK